PRPALRHWCIWPSSFLGHWGALTGHWWGIPAEGGSLRDDDLPPLAGGGDREEAEVRAAPGHRPADRGAHRQEHADQRRPRGDDRRPAGLLLVLRVVRRRRDVAAAEVRPPLV